ncbi:MAG: tyrosine-type recombinase/integrase [Chloroflexi bacterium]|nr:tyrosine-type recombinase/integrase [Chloroflexota bacterium]
MARRGPGEGSINKSKRKDGRYMARITLDDGKRKYFYGKTKEEVRSQMIKALADLQEGKLITGPSQTVAQYLNRWLTDIVSQSVRPRTQESYVLNVRRVLPHIGKLRLTKLQPAHIQACYAALLEGGLSRRSVEQCHTVLHRALRQALQWEMIGRNPTEAVSVPRPKRREMHTLTAHQVQDLFASSTEDCLHALWVLLATTGLRLGEATGLKWDDIDFATGKLTVRRALQRQTGTGLVFVEPKTEGSRRTIHLAESTVAILREHRRTQLAQRLESGPAWQDRGLVFCTSVGSPLEPARVNEAFHLALSKAGLPRLRVHDLRHTAATLLLSRGVHPKVVQEFLGHSTITLTLDTYSHVIPSLHSEVASHMESLFQRSGQQ